MMGNAKEWVPVAIMSGVKSVNPEEQREGNAFGVSRPPPHLRVRARFLRAFPRIPWATIGV